MKKIVPVADHFRGQARTVDIHRNGPNAGCST